MIVTDRLVFLHLHKSGGTFVNSLLMRCVPSARHVGYHLPYRDLAPEYRQLPVLGTVRSPWAYYVSWYHFQASLPNPNVLFRICSDGGKLGFRGTISNLVNLTSDEGRLKLLEEGLPHDYARQGLNLRKKDVAELRERQVGFYSFLYERLYAGAEAPVVLRTEDLREELRSALASFGYLPDPCAEQFLAEAPALNASRHDPPAAYYDDELAAVVGDRDRGVIERFAYRL